jgi:hypothetical protein
MVQVITEQRLLTICYGNQPRFPMVAEFQVCTDSDD